MAATGVVLGFYRDEDTAREALHELRRQDLGQSAAIFKSPGGRARVEDKGISPRRGAIFGASAGMALGAVAALLPGARAVRPALVLGSAIAGALGGGAASRFLDFGVSNRLLARYGRWLVNDETLVVVQARPAQMERALTVLRETGNQSPAIFVVRPTNRRLAREEKKLLRAPSIAGESTIANSLVQAAPAPREPLTAERLQARARRLASSHRVTCRFFP